MAGPRVVGGGLSSQSVRPSWELTGEARSQPGGLQGQRVGPMTGDAAVPIMRPLIREDHDPGVETCALRSWRG